MHVDKQSDMLVTILHIAVRAETSNFHCNKATAFIALQQLHHQSPAKKNRNSKKRTQCVHDFNSKLNFKILRSYYYYNTYEKL